MIHYRDLADLRLKRSALTIGSFDGVHRGHQALIRDLVESAHQSGLPAVVLTFYPHPSVVLRERSPSFYITTPEEKAELLASLGIDCVITQTFDLQLSRVAAEDFLDLLQQGLGFRGLWAGSDFALGYDRRGNRHFLERAAKQRDFDFHVVPPFNLEGEAVSSTRVREALRSGDVARVAQYLGRPFTLPGKVVPGAGRGKDLGIPTANLALWEERAVPGHGVYACTAQLGGQAWMAVANIGLRPTFQQSSQSLVVEAHLLDFPALGLYDQQLRLLFHDRLRDERKFNGPQELLAQIQRDIQRAREILGRIQPGNLD